MSTLPHDILREVALNALHKSIGGELTGIRTGVQSDLDGLGIERLGARLPDGTRVATITVSNPQPKAVVTDEKAFVAFMEDFAPTEVMTIKIVRPAYVTKVLDEMTKFGAAQLADPNGGELADVDGVEMQTARAASHSVTWDGDGLNAVIAAMRSGALSHIDGLPQLTQKGSGQ